MSPASLYKRFADEEAQGVSAAYERLARRVADDAGLLAFLLTLPAAKRQPNLLFGAVRLMGGDVLDEHAFCRYVLANAGRVRDTMLARRTQTNEPARTAVLLPVLARLPAPLGLVEVGASAGLCLQPERYAFIYSGAATLRPADVADPPLFECAANPLTPLPRSLPDVVWRAGVDLNPLDAGNPEDVAWLQALVWPEHTRRRENLAKALVLAAQQPPPIKRGDLLDELPRLLADVPAGATPVLFHSAVLAYLDAAGRRAFRELVAASAAVWVSNEHPGVFPDIAARAERAGVDLSDGRSFVLAVNGVPVALTGPHGQSIDWFATDDAWLG